MELITDVIGTMPYRMAFAGGWIDQPFVSRLDPAPPGSMVVVALEPTCRFMDRCGMGTSTRKVAERLWGGALPDRDPAALVRRVVRRGERGQAEPSGSQDMIGLIYPGVNRLDYDFDHEGGYFPVHIESNSDPAVARWLEASHPDGAGRASARTATARWAIKNLDPGVDPAAGADGQGLLRRDRGAGMPRGLGASMNECMACWEAILPAHRAPPDDHGRPRWRSCATTRPGTPAPCIPAAAAGISTWSPRSRCRGRFR